MNAYAIIDFVFEFWYINQYEFIWQCDDLFGYDTKSIVDLREMLRTMRTFNHTWNHRHEIHLFPQLLLHLKSQYFEINYYELHILSSFKSVMLMLWLF